MTRTIPAAELIASPEGKQLLDVRRSTDFEASTEAIPGAIRQDPADVANWSRDLDRSAEVIVYCVRGGSVSNAVIDALHAQGVAARYIEGGIEGWKAAGGIVTARDSVRSPA
ncbi:MAG: rhodanese-like domain-containing protein [Gammaproteobacteria bacterium]